MTAQKLPQDEEEQQEKQESSQISLSKLLVVLMTSTAASAARFNNALNSLDPDKLDAKKLLTDPKYRQSIQDNCAAVRDSHFFYGLTKKKERGKVGNAEEALKQAKKTHLRLLVLKTNFGLNALQSLISAYSLKPEEIEAIKKAAWARIKENPTLSINDALRIEAENLRIRQIRSEVEKEAKDKGERLTKKQIDERVEERTKGLESKKEEFETSTASLRTAEDEQTKAIVDSYQKDLEQKGVVTPSSLDAATTPSQTYLQRIAGKIQERFDRFKAKINEINEGIKSKISNLFSQTFKDRLSQIFHLIPNIINGFNKRIATSFIGKFIKNTIGKVTSVFSRFSRSAIRTVAARAMDAVAPGLGTAYQTLAKASEALSKLIGIDIVKTTENLVLIIILGLAVGIPAVFFLLLTSPLQSNTSYILASDPLELGLKDKSAIGWFEFEKKFLSVKENKNTACFSSRLSDYLRDKFVKENINQ